MWLRFLNFKKSRKTLLFLIMNRLLAFSDVHKEVTVAVIRPDIVSEGKVDEVIEKVRIVYCYCLLLCCALL